LGPVISDCFGVSLANKWRTDSACAADNLSLSNTLVAIAGGKTEIAQELSAMATNTFTEPHTIVQAWISVSAAQQLKANARAEGCSLSALIRDCLQEQLQTSPNTSGDGAAPRRVPFSSFSGSPGAADPKEKG
jgi:hypothetical protein